MNTLTEKTKIFREQLAQLSREDLLEIISGQDPEILKGINRIEWVFENKLHHLTWGNGDPILGRQMTNYELSLLIDEPFQYDEELAAMGVTIEQQKQLHIAKDPVTWAKHFLNVESRVYQTVMLRDPSLYKVLRAGRRLGKTVTMALTLLHYSYTTKNGKSLVVTPMLAQAKLIYEKIMEFVQESPVVLESITRNVLNPQAEIGFSNGSTIRFFTSGMKSGGKADITRGQEASLIVLDELDYMGDDDLEALFAMLQKTDKNQSEKRMIGASTPSGRHAVFWEWCTNPKFGFKEFWFPSYVNPYWSKKDEDFFRNQYSEMGFRHEIEADWGENVEGVYPRRLVDKAFKEPGWDYVAEPAAIGDLYSAENMYIIGVDWDRYGAGTNIVVLEVFDKKTYRGTEYENKVRVAYREETSREEFSLTRSVDRIIELNARFQPRHIYVDRGFGEVQVELLHKEGMNNPRSNLKTKVKGISFSESIEVRDPYTMQKVKKEIKPFMVDNLLQMLESEQIIFPADDTELYSQLTAYVVARQTATGRPVFEASGKAVDHAHDALILACLAITQNYGDLMKANYATQSKVVSNTTFLPMVDPKSSPKNTEVKKETNKAAPAGPVAAKRSMSYNIRGRSRPIKRKSF